MQMSIFISLIIIYFCNLNFIINLTYHCSKHSYSHLNNLRYSKLLSSFQESHFICTLPLNFKLNQSLLMQSNKLYLNLALFHIEILKSLEQDPISHNYMV